MNAIVYTRYGGPDVLTVMAVDTPVAGKGEVLIRIHAAEATKADCEMRSFNFPVKWFWLPLRLILGPFKPRNPILGGYFAGRIEAVGRDVTRFAKGDDVFGASRLRLGTYGEYLCLPGDYTIAHKPVNMTFEEAAAVPLGGLNALHFMTRADIQKGDTLLINGAGGSIGTFAVQIAKAMGAEVTAVDSAHKEKMLRRIGADHFVDYEREDFTRSGQRYDVIFDMVAQSSYAGCLRALNAKGRYLMGNPRLCDMLRSVVTSMFTARRATFAFARETQEELLALKKMIEAGEIRSLVDQVYPMEQAAEAHRRVETEQRVGVVVIAISA